MALDRLDIEGVDFGIDDPPDLHEILAGLRREAPFAVVPFGGGKAILLLTNELVTAAFKDENTFPASATYSMSTEAVLGHTIQCMAGREHLKHRALVTPAFRRKLVTEYVEPLLVPTAHELVDRFAGRGEADLVTEFTTQYPILVITRLLGLPIDDEATFHRWAVDLFSFPFHPDAARRASAEFTEYLLPILAERRKNPGDDLISTLVGTEIDGERLTDDEILPFVRLLFPAGADTTVNGLGNAVTALLTHPEQLARVVADPATEARWAVEEALRWEPPVGLLPRVCPADADWHGIEIPAGAPVLFAITAANRDPAVYPDPDTFDVGRRAMATLAFGDGPHVCLGTWLALAEMETGLRILVERLPGLRPAPGAEIRVGSRLGAALRGPASLPARWNEFSDKH